MKVRYRPRAVADLIGIADYLGDRSPPGARAVEERIHATIELLRQFPESGRILEQRSQVRAMPIGRHPYLMFYTVSGDEIVVLHIRHGARRPTDPKDL